MVGVLPKKASLNSYSHQNILTENNVYKDIHFLVTVLLGLGRWILKHTVAYYESTLYLQDAKLYISSFNINMLTKLLIH